MLQKHITPSFCLISSFSNEYDPFYQNLLSYLFIYTHPTSVYGRGFPRLHGLKLYCQNRQAKQPSRFYRRDAHFLIIAFVINCHQFIESSHQVDRQSQDLVESVTFLSFLINHYINHILVRKYVQARHNLDLLGNNVIFNSVLTENTFLYQI